MVNEFPNLDGKKLKDFRKNLKDRCTAMGLSLETVLGVIERLEVISVSDGEIIADLKKAIAENFYVNTEAVDIYISALKDQFLGWAKERKTIAKADIESVRAVVGEKMSAEEQFRASGRVLIHHLTWIPDHNNADFFDGKLTRPGHVAANLDVPRPLWLKKIEKAFESMKVCVVLSSSGQGKSTLIYRFARQQQFIKNTFILRIAETPEHVGLVIKYLRFLSEITPSALVLIDNAGWSTRLWPLIAQECAALGIKVLVSSRQEDWYRFRQESLTGYELVEPILNKDEAKDIYSIYRKENRLHRGVVSAEWAYERVGEPHLLMEYIYLLTHGHMLEERLRDQVRQFQRLEDDPSKVEILRRVSVAHMLGCHLRTDKLLKDIPLRKDPQDVMGSLAQECIGFENGHVRGLHWVRSDHLARILHDPFPAASTTALAILDAIPPSQVKSFIASALSNEIVDKKKFLAGIIEISKTKELREILTILEGTLKGGERIFFEAHRDIFDEALRNLRMERTYHSDLEPCSNPQQSRGRSGP